MYQRAVSLHASTKLATSISRSTVRRAITALRPFHATHLPARAGAAFREGQLPPSLGDAGGRRSRLEIHNLYVPAGGDEPIPRST